MLADLGCADLKWHDERIQWKQRPTDESVHICTGQYRPPDMLLGSLRFGPDLDLWSLGCVAAELFLREPLFQPRRPSCKERSALETRFEIQGTPAMDSSTHAWMKSLPLFAKLYAARRPPAYPYQWPPTRLRGCQAQLADFVRQTLQWLPQERLTAASASQHEFVSSRALSVSVSVAPGKKRARLHCPRQPR